MYLNHPETIPHPLVHGKIVRHLKLVSGAKKVGDWWRRKDRKHWLGFSFFFKINMCCAMLNCWRRQWHPTPALLPGKSHGRRSLEGCSPWGSLRVGYDWATSLSLFTFIHWRRKWQPTPVLLPGESQGLGSLVGSCLWGHRVGHDWSDLAVAACLISQSCPTLCEPMECHSLKDSAVSVVAQSRTRLKRLSSSSSSSSSILMAFLFLVYLQYIAPM